MADLMKLFDVFAASCLGHKGVPLAKMFPLEVAESGGSKFLIVLMVVARIWKADWIKLRLTSGFCVNLRTSVLTLFESLWSEFNPFFICLNLVGNDSFLEPEKVLFLILVYDTSKLS